MTDRSDASGLILACLATVACVDREMPPADEGVLELDWDLAQDEASNAPVCPPDRPACDAIDEMDAVDANDRPITGSIEALGDPQRDTGTYRVWPGGRIPYRFARRSGGGFELDAATRAELGRAMTNWELLTEGRIKFRPATSDDVAFVRIERGETRVRPFIGYRAGQIQQLILRDNEYLTVMKHELGHVIGLHHEQRRVDRNDYIQVRTENIVTGDGGRCANQFAICASCAHVGTYDRRSVMHYRTHDLRGCQRGPIVLQLDGSPIGHPWQVSPKDLDAVAKMYGPKRWPLHPQPVDPAAEGSLRASAELCADVAKASTGDGAPVIGWTCHGRDHQDWRATRAAQLRVRHSSRCIAAAGDDTLAQARCDASAADQRWTFPAVEVVHGSGRCLEVPRSGTFAGQRVRLAACSGRVGQRFRYRPTLETIDVDGACLTAGDRVTLEPCRDDPRQRWVPARGGFVTRADTGRCLVASPDGIAVGECADDRWAVRGEIRDGRTDRCITAAAKGDPLVLAPCDRRAQQRWSLWSR